jgi:cation diffusion facilitator CzcD-associated flavoprotein CzcO
MQLHAFSIPLVLLVFGSLVRSEALEKTHKPSVAIIGAGVGGSTSSWFIRNLLREDVTIDMYEFLGKLRAVHESWRKFIWQMLIHDVYQCELTPV